MNLDHVTHIKFSPDGTYVFYIIIKVKLSCVVMFVLSCSVPL